jgi:hypothetical protein
MTEKLPVTQYESAHKGDTGSGGTTPDDKSGQREPQPPGTRKGILGGDISEEEVNRDVENALARMATGASEDTRAISKALTHFLNEQKPSEEDAIQSVPFFLKMPLINQDMVRDVLRMKGFNDTQVENIVAQGGHRELPEKFNLGQQVEHPDSEKEAQARGYEAQAKQLVEGDKEFQQVLKEGKDAPESVKKSVQQKMGSLEMDMSKVLVGVGYTLGVTFILYLMLLRIASNAMGGGKK